MNIAQYLNYVPLAVLLIILCVFHKFIGKALSDNGQPSSTRIGWVSIVLTFCYVCFYHYSDATVATLVCLVCCIFIMGGWAKISDIGNIVDSFNKLKSFKDKQDEAK